MYSKATFSICVVICLQTQINSAVTNIKEKKGEKDLKELYKLRQRHRKASNTGIVELVYYLFWII